MGKAKAERRLNENEARAVARTIRVSPQKLNLVAQLIRGKRVDAALADLTFSRKTDRRNGEEDARKRGCECRETIMISTSTR